MKIYTKAGDGGNTFLAGGKKVPKDDPSVEALGTVDELNAFLGGAKALSKGSPGADILSEIQKLIHVLGADLSAPPGTKAQKNLLRILPLHTAWAEKRIDALEASLPPLAAFLIPGGSPAGAALHVARAVCRRAERRVAALLKKKRASKDALIFLNRLSDLLFLLARDADRREGAPETPQN